MEDGGVRRRLAAILAADVAGYSRLMGDDERATIACLRDYRDVFRANIEAHGGRVVDMAGDSVLAVFDSAAGAVESAVATQADLAKRNEALPDNRRMQFRVGVNLGDIEEAEDGTVYGDGVNVAARLEGMANPGGINVSGSVFDSVRAHLDLPFDFLGEHEVKNITDPVRAYRVGGDGRLAPETSRLRRRAAAGVAALIGLILAVGIWWQFAGREQPEMLTADGTPTDDPVLAMPTGPSIAVLPFDNLSGDPEQQYFANGLTDDLITELARFTDLRVLAQNATRQFGGGSTDFQTIGKELGVDYLMDGSVQKSPDRIRINVQLIEVESGAHLWADKLDRDPSDIFEIQDEISSRIASMVAGGHGQVQRARVGDRRTGQNVARAYDYILLARDSMLAYSKENYELAIEYLHKAIELDPESAAAHRELAWMKLVGWIFRFDTSYAPSDEVKARAIRAVELDPYDPSAQRAAAYGYFFDKQMDLFERAAAEVLRLSPYDSELVVSIGFLFLIRGDWEKGNALLDKANALNPLGAAGWYHSGKFYDHYRQGSYEEALAVIRQSPGAEVLSENFVKFAAVYGRLGQAEKAQEFWSRLKDVEPGWSFDSVRNICERWSFPDSLCQSIFAGIEAGGIKDVAEPDRPVIAVLPFRNLSGDPNQDYFTDGITEDVIASLTKFRGFRTIAPSTVFAYNADESSPGDFASKFGADYVVAGSVRRAPSRIRVIVKLLDSRTDTHIWGDTYESDLTPENIFAVQDEVASQVTARIGDFWGIVTNSGIRRERRSVPESMASYDCLLQVYEFYRTMREDDHKRVRSCLEDTVKRDPDYSDAWAWLANIYNEEHAYGFNSQPNSLDRSLEAALRATDLDPRNFVAYASLADVYFYRGEKYAFRVAAERALELNPNNSTRIGLIGLQTAQFGDWEDGIALVEEAMRLNPDHPGWLYLGHTLNHYRNGDYEAAAKAAEEMGLHDWNYALLLRAAAYGQLGMPSKAQESIQKLLEIDVAFTEHPRELLRRHNLDSEFVERVMDGLRKAGLEIPYEVN